MTPKTQPGAIPEDVRKLAQEVVGSGGPYEADLKVMRDGVVNAIMQDRADRSTLPDQPEAPGVESSIGSPAWCDMAERSEWAFMAQMLGEAIEQIKPVNLSGLAVAKTIAEARAKDGWRTTAFGPSRAALSTIPNEEHIRREAAEERIREDERDRLYEKFYRDPWVHAKDTCLALKLQDAMLPSDRAAKRTEATDER